MDINIISNNENRLVTFTESYANNVLNRIEEIENNLEEPLKVIKLFNQVSNTQNNILNIVQSRINLKNGSKIIIKLNGIFSKIIIKLLDIIQKKIGCCNKYCIVRKTPEASWVKYLKRGDCIDGDPCKNKYKLNKNNTIAPNSNNISRYIRRAGISRGKGHSTSSIRRSIREFRTFNFKDTVDIDIGGNIQQANIYQPFQIIIDPSDNSSSVNRSWEDVTISFTLSNRGAGIPTNIVILPPLENGFTVQNNLNSASKSYVIKGQALYSFFQTYTIIFQNYNNIRRFRFSLYVTPFSSLTKLLSDPDCIYKKITNEQVKSLNENLQEEFLPFDNSYIEDNEANVKYKFIVNNLNQINNKYIAYFDISNNDYSLFQNKTFYITDCNTGNYDNIDINVGFVYRKLDGDPLISLKGRPLLKLEFELKDGIDNISRNNTEKIIDCSVMVKYKVVEQSINNKAIIAFKNLDTLKFGIQLVSTKNSIKWDSETPYDISQAILKNIICASDSKFKETGLNTPGCYNETNLINEYSFIIPSLRDTSNNKLLYTTIQYNPSIKTLYNYDDITYICTPSIDTHVKNIFIDNKTGIIRPFMTLENKPYQITSTSALNDMIVSGNNGLFLEISGMINYINDIPSDLSNYNYYKVKSNFNVHRLKINNDSKFTLQNDISVNIIDLDISGSVIDLSNNISINFEENYFDLLSIHKIDLSYNDSNANTIKKSVDILLRYKRTQDNVLENLEYTSGGTSLDIISQEYPVSTSRILTNKNINNLLNENVINKADSNPITYYPGWIIYNNVINSIGINTIIKWQSGDVITLNYILPQNSSNEIITIKDNGYYSFNGTYITFKIDDSYSNNSNNICKFQIVSEEIDEEVDNIIKINPYTNPYYQDDNEFRINPKNGTIYSPFKWSLNINYFIFYLTVRNNLSINKKIIHKQRIIVNNLK